MKTTEVVHELFEDEAVNLTRIEFSAFCEEYQAHPYLCYTEHGQHCRFASRLSTHRKTTRGAI